MDGIAWFGDALHDLCGVDELIVESAKACAEQAKEILVREMEAAAALKVPLTAEAAMGENWYEAK